MTIFSNFALGRREDATLQVQLLNNVSTVGWSVQLTAAKRFGSDTLLFTKTPVATDGQGQFTFSIAAADTSGLDFGNYCFDVTRFDTGQRTILSQGYLLLLPNVG